MKLSRLHIGIALAIAACALAFVALFVVKVPDADPQTAASETAVEAEEAPDSSSAAPTAAPAATDESFEPAAAPAAEPYEPGVLLVTLADGATADEALAQIAAAPGLAGVAISEVIGDDLVEVALPEGVAVDQALESIDAMKAAQPESAQAIAGVQPNYRYYVQEAVSGGDMPEYGHPTGSVTPVGTLSERPSTAVGGRSESVPTKMTWQVAKSATETLTELLIQPPTEVTDLVGYRASDTAPLTAVDGRAEARPYGAQANAPVLAAVSTVIATQAITVNDARRSSQWALDSLNVPDAWQRVVDSSSTNAVTVAVMDEGFLTAHEDLKDVVVGAYNASSSFANRAVGAAFNPNHSSHGTHVAGIIAAEANNSVGIAGVAYNTEAYSTCKLMPIRVAESDGGIYTSSIVKGYNYLLGNTTVSGITTTVAKRYNVRVVNLSLGTSRAEQDGVDANLESAVARAWNAGIVTVAAACNIDDGKYYTPFPSYPADLENVVGVISLARSNNSDGVIRAESSNFNTATKASSKTKNISAPGESIWSTYCDDDSPSGGWSFFIRSAISTDEYANLSGTSMAAPAVSGVLALMFKANPDLTAQQAVNTLYSTARDLTQGSLMAKGWDRASGYGEADASAAVAAVLPAVTGPTRVALGGEAAFTVTVGGQAVTTSGWTWASSNTSVARVSSSGVVTGIANGKAQISASRNGLKATATVTVSGPVSLSGLSISLPTTKLTYTGSPCKPAPVVREGGARLKAGLDYRVVYSNNVNAGTAKATVVGIAPYQGKAELTFTIGKAPMNAASIQLSATTFTYDGTKKTPTVTVRDINGAKTQLVRGVDYRLKTVGAKKGAGRVVVTATAKCANFTGSTTKTFTVKVVKASVYQLYNARTGQWFYTTSASERAAKVRQGWTRRGVAFKAPSKSKKKVWRMYNAKTKSYRLAASASQRSRLANAGWKSRKVAFYADAYKARRVYAYRSNATGAWRYSTATSLAGYTRVSPFTYAL